MLNSSIGHVFDDVLEALHEVAPEKLAEIVRRAEVSFADGIASAQRGLGLLMVHAAESMDEELPDVGWLVTAMAEMSVSWRQCIEQVGDEA